MRSMRTGSGPERDFPSKSSRSGRFKFKPVGPGVLGFEPDVTGRDFTFLRFVEAIEDRDGGRPWLCERWLGLVRGARTPPPIRNSNLRTVCESILSRVR